MLIVRVPYGRMASRQYVAGVVLGEFLGLDWRMHAEDRHDVLLTLEGSNAELSFPDSLFSFPEAQWLTSDLVPPADLPALSLSSELRVRIGYDDVPVLFGRMDRPACHHYCPVDIFGSVFFLLSRYEEFVSDPLLYDSHQRFSSKSSLGFRAGFLHRPLVDEYVELLWSAMRTIWPLLRRRIRTYCLHLSCDVDRPFDDRLRSFPMLVGDVLSGIRRSDWASACARMRERFALARHGDIGDPNFAFGDYMSIAESIGLRATFNFLCGGESAYDATYRIDDPRIVRLMRCIHERGHSIGLHGSYASAFDADLLVREAARLRAVLADNGIAVGVIEGRQHYLRWRADGGWRAAVAADLLIDSTLGYADGAGFRCGTSHEFPVFDLRTDCALPLRERPLVAMDVTLMSPLYGGDFATAMDKIAALSATCRRYDGTFSLLWHNNGIGRISTADMLREALRVAAGVPT